jgi:hypothetical protein
MTDKEKMKDFWFRFKIFLWYLRTEPIRQIGDLLKVFMKFFQSFNKTITWAYVFSFFSVFFLFTGKKPWAGLLLLGMLAIILIWEWQRGYFMHKYRKAVKKKVQREVRENEPFK